MMDTSYSEDPMTYCAVHTDREASLRCIRCDRYMCTQCVNQTPVGYVCNECHRRQDDKFFNATTRDYGIKFTVSAVLAGIISAIISTLGMAWLFLFFIGIIGGSLISEAISRTTGRRRGRYSHWFAIGGTATGALIGTLLALINLYNENLAMLRAALQNEGIPEAEISQYIPTLTQHLSNVLPTEWGVFLFVAITAFILYQRYNPGKGGGKR